jgi:CBS domain-containing protein
MTRINSSDSQPVQHVHTGRGREIDRAIPCAEVDPELPRMPTIADIVPLAEIMTRDMVCARSDLSIEEVSALMLRHHVGCIPVVDEGGRPIGMITKLDLLEAEPSGGHPPRVAAQLMMPMALTLDEHATIVHAASLMATEDIHHVLVVNDERRLIGIVSTMDIVRWLARNDGFSAI